MMNEKILLYSIKISLPDFERFLTKNSTKSFNSYEEMEKYLKEFAQNNKVAFSLLYTEYAIIPLQEYNRIKNFVSKFLKKDQNVDDLIIIIYMYEEEVLIDKI